MLNFNFNYNISDPVKKNNITIFFLQSKTKLENNFLTLEESISKSLVDIKEINSKGTIRYLKVSNKSNFEDCLFASNSEGIKTIYPKLNLRNTGCAALDLAYVGCGRFDGYWQRELNYWDIAAGVIIIKEAGGFVDFFEEDKQHPLKRNIIATNSIIHEKLRDLIEKKDIE